MKQGFILALNLIFAIFVRLFHLSELPAEWFGDISNVHEYVNQIINGDWPFYFFQSPGPLYHYLITPIVILFRNQDFYTYKLASIIVSVLGLVGIYFFAKELKSTKLALVTVLISAFSFWYLVWSRLGNSQIVIPALIAFSSYFLFRFIKYDNHWDLFKTIIIASLGWITYPQTFIWPPFVFVFTLLLLLIKPQENKNRNLSVLFLSAVIGILPLIFIFKGQAQGLSGNFGSGGYLGSKVMPLFDMDPGEIVGKTFNNLAKTYLSLHIEGDRIFRVNIPGRPNLDVWSRVLFLLGSVYLLRNLKLVFSLYILSALLILPLPSVSPALPEIEIPNSSRIIAYIPFVYFIVATGIFQLYIWLKKILNRSFIIIILSVLMIAIVRVNFTNYFFVYAQGLPNGNLGPSRFIAGYIDKHFPIGVNLYFVQCCWGFAGEPEPKAVLYNLRKRGRGVFINKLIDSCEELRRPALLVYRDKMQLESKFQKCSQEFVEHNIVSDKNIYISKIAYWE